MSTRAFLRAALLIPYLLWVLITLLYRTAQSADLQLVRAFLELPMLLYVVGIYFWGIPYAVLALFLLLWSVGRPADRFRWALLMSPLVLPLLIILYVFCLAASFAGPPIQPNPGSPGEVLAGVLYIVYLTVLATVFSLPFSAACIGIAIGVQRLLIAVGFVHDEDRRATDLEHARIP